MRILVFGKNGQVARALAGYLENKDTRYLGSADADLTVAGTARQAIEAHKPEIIINAAAFTDVKSAETDVDSAESLNIAAPIEMAIAARKLNAAFVHISTDYVFDGKLDKPYKENMPTNPLNVYGRTKRDGEAGVLEENPDAVIMRTSWVFSEHGGNFLKTMLKISENQDSATIIDDQIGGPTGADDIAGAIKKITERFADAESRTPVQGGIYHFQGAPAVSWAGFAREIFDAADREMSVTPTLTKDYPSPVERPLRTVLDCRKIDGEFGVKQPDWRDATRAVVAKLLATGGSR